MKRTSKFRPHDVSSEQRSDGTLLLSSNAEMGDVVDTSADWLHRWSEDAPERIFLAEKRRAITGAFPILLLVLVTIGGIYRGIFSPEEAAGVCAGMAVVYGFATRTLGVKVLLVAVQDSVVTSATVMLILIAAHLLNPFFALTHITEVVGNFLSYLDLGMIGTLLFILSVYLILGCFLEGFAMLVLTLPIFFPVVLEMGIDPIWFAMIVALAILIAFPQISLQLPNSMFN